SHSFLSSSRLQVVAGLRSQSRLGSAVQRRSVERVIVYEDYDQTLHGNDVALLRLFSPLFFSSHVQPVCTLTNQAEERELGFTCCFISGWGSTIYKGLLQHKEAEVELIDTETCNQRDWYRGSVTSSMLCAGLEHGGVDTCQVTFTDLLLLL
uniref:Peptidase S1 domain-containing protein n=1 Tax=Astyanax mexicanus TaxID=7994 RepID=A0A8B9LKI4_ASTMX